MGTSRAGSWVLAGALGLSLAAGLGLRLRAALAQGGGAALTGDDGEYYAMGLSMRDDGILYDPHLDPWRPGASRAMLYPAFIGLTARPGSGPLGTRLAQALLGALGLLLAYGLGRSLRSPAAGALAALFVALSPPLIGAAGSLYIEGFFSFLLLLAGWALARWAEKPDARATALLGLALGLTLACRSTLFALPPLLAAWLLARGAPRAGRLAALLLACAYLPLVPWTLRNARHFREFVPFERHKAYFTLYTATHGVVEMAGGDAQAYRLAGLDGAGPGNQDDREEALLALARARLRAEPGVYLGGVARRLGAELGWLGGFLGWGALALAGLGAWSARRRPAVTALLLALLYFLAVHALLAGQSRFLVPLIPWAAALGAVGVAVLLEGLKSPWAAGAEPAWAARAARGAAALGGGLGALLYAACLACIAREALALKPGAGLLGPRGELVAGPGAFAHSVTALTRRLAAAPADPGLYKDRGVAYFLDGRPAEAAADFERALALAPGDESVRSSLAAARAALK